jgi:DNA-binding CsgD family transcriptional regulator/transcriptional regulator with XRE-family HTH domain
MTSIGISPGAARAAAATWSHTDPTAATDGPGGFSPRQNVYSDGLSAVVFRSAEVFAQNLELALVGGRSQRASRPAAARESFATLLQRWRLAAGLSQAELAEGAGLSQRGISDLERGVRRNPHPATARQLATALGLDDVDRALLLEARSGNRRTQPAIELTRPHMDPPRELTRSLGHEHERTGVAGRLREAAMVTIAGPGGAGTTRLALRLRRRADGLTAREYEVGLLLARGLTNRQVAEALVTAEKTAKNHVQRVLDKLGVRTRAELAARAEELGLRWRAALDE